MKPRTLVILYWVITISFCLAMTGDAIGGITRQQAGIDALKHLGYPLYNLQMYGIAKILGVLAILQTRFKTIKEWAYAGFSFNFISAFLSRAIMGDDITMLIPPVVISGVMFISYFLWHRLMVLKAGPLRETVR